MYSSLGMPIYWCSLVAYWCNSALNVIQCGRCHGFAVNKLPNAKPLGLCPFQAGLGMSKQMISHPPGIIAK